MKIYIIFALLFFTVVAQAQNCTISGVIEDKETGEKIIGAYVYIEGSGAGTATNNFGFYSLTVPSGKQVRVNFSYIGYRKQTQSIRVSSNETYNIQLIADNQLKEVKVQANDKTVNTPITGINTIPVKQFKNLPSITGENDILLAFQMMPGVQNGNEGTGALFVRGGSADQNLYLLDGVPIYYVNHLGGFVSVFDENSINSIKLYKGGFPAEYNGKLSSILDVRLKDGNKQKIHGEVKVDLLASKVFIEGPMLRKKATFMVSVRRCNVDLITRTLLRYNGPDMKSVFGYSFTDLNFKFNFPLGTKDAVSAFGYYGRDRMFDKSNGTGSPFESPYTYKQLWQTVWGNKVGGIRWNHILSSKLFTNLHLAYTAFNYSNSLNVKEISTSTGDLNYENRNKTGSSVADLIAKFETDFYPVSTHKIKFGGVATLHTFKPTSTHYFQSGTKKIDTLYGDINIKAKEFNAFASYEGHLGKRFSFNIGVNATWYSTNSLQFFNYQPRFIANLLILKNLSLKTSYSETTQCSHLLSSSNIGMPTDMWLPATTLAKPETSGIYSAALVNSFKNYEITAEVFYKEMNNLIDFKEASTFSQNASWINKIETKGKGTAYGFEFLIQKQSGKFNGWISYTWSKNDRQFANINDGKSYPFKFDRRHDLSIVLNYDISRNVTLSAAWLFSSGAPITIGIGEYKISEIYNFNDFTRDRNIHTFNEFFATINQDAIYIGGRNNYRLPDYHRLDIGAIFTKQKKYGKRQLKLGIYNVYNHLNPYYLYYEYNYQQKKMELFQFCLFPIIPSVSWSYVF